MINPQILKGVGVALVTPFLPGGAIDYAALENLINLQVANKTDYLVTLGTTGETVTLTQDERVKVLEFTLEKAAGRLPVVVGMGGNNTAENVNSLKTCPIEQCAAVLSVSPYYNKPSQEGIYRHYSALAQATDKPILLYNVPGRTGSNITPETTFRLARDHKNIIGTKEASGNMVQCMHLIAGRPDNFLLISGDDHVTLPLIACGFDGVISVASNSFSADFNRLVHLALDGNFREASLLQSKLLAGFDLLFAENNPAGVKAFLYEQGLIKNVLRLPLTPLSAAVHQKVKEFHSVLFN